MHKALKETPAGRRIVSKDFVPSNGAFKIEIMKKYLLTTAWGFAGMFIAHILLFIIAVGFKLNYMPYMIAYPIVYILLAFILTINNPNWWFSNVICILLIPFVYWYLLLWSGGKFHVADAVKVRNSSGMLLILPFTFLLATLVSFYIFKRKQRIQSSR
jgi:hypothetical protein